MIRNRQINELVRDLELPTVDARPVRPGTGQGARCSTAWSSGCCASGCRRDTRRPTSRRPRVRAAACRRPGEVAAWLGRARSTGDRVGVAVQGSGVAAPADLDRPGAGDRRRGGPGSTDAHDSPRTTRRRWQAWLADPKQPKALHDAKGRCSRWRAWLDAGRAESDTQLSAYLARPDQRSYDLADLTVRYLQRELRDDRGRQRRSSASTTSTTASGRGRTMLRARAVADLADALDTELEKRGGDAAAGRGRAAADRRARRDGAGRHRRRRRTWRSWRPSSPPR